MSNKPISVTYEVTFTEELKNGKRVYKANTAYTFKTRSESTHPGDMFDNAWIAVHHVFGCLSKGTFIRILPLKYDPKIISFN